MKARYLNILFACAAVLSAAIAAEAMTPRTDMARSENSFDLAKVIPVAFGQWKPVPGVRIVEPPGSDTLAHEIYSQELARGYSDSDGHVVMLLIAYGASQSDRLQLHRPEICYAAQGFRVSRPTNATLSFRAGWPPLKITRLVTQREERFEPLTYWMRIGDDVATGVVERQILKVEYGLHGLIPDGALIRVSAVGLPADAAFEVQAQFIKDLLASVDQPTLSFLAGDPAKALSVGL